jgi:transposase InsO family protein
MPWKELKPMDERILFVADYLRQIGSVSELCDRYGVSRKTGYKWLGRYQLEGAEGLEDRSRRPHQQPAQLPFWMRQAIIELRKPGRTERGPKKIHALLAVRYPDQDLPSKTSIYNVLKQAGLIHTRQRHRRVAPSTTGLHGAHQPNGLWSADFKGQFLTGDGRWCYPLTVMDHASRYLLECRALPGPRRQDTQAVFEQLFQRYGLPERLRTDNGVPFAGAGPAGLSRLSIWWVRLGIVPERIQPGRPQQNGRHERMHRTLKRAATQPPGPNLRAQQRRLDGFREDYNAHRPHESLQQRTPASVYVCSPRQYPSRLPELSYPHYMQISRVSPNGVIYWKTKRIYIGYKLAGQPVGLEQIGDGLWEVFFGPLRLGRFDQQRPARGRDYFTLNCHPCV